MFKRVATLGNLSMRIVMALSVPIDYVYCDKPIDSICLYRVSFIAFTETSRNAIDPCLACGSGLFDRHCRRHHGLSVLLLEHYFTLTRLLNRMSIP